MARRFAGGFFDRTDRARRRQIDEAGDALYRAALAEARRAVFYADLGVPDSVDGRFEMVVLHVVLLVRRLEAAGDQPLAQALFDRMFVDMDRSLREMGVGDLSVGRHIRRMAEGFFGRKAAYGEALAGDRAALAEALRRNLYGTVEAGESAVLAVAGYAAAAADDLDRQPEAALREGRVRFPDPPAPVDPPAPRA